MYQENDKFDQLTLILNEVVEKKAKTDSAATNGNQIAPPVGGMTTMMTYFPLPPVSKA